VDVKTLLAANPAIASYQPTVRVNLYTGDEREGRRADSVDDLDLVRREFSAFESRGNRQHWRRPKPMCIGAFASDRTRDEKASRKK